MKKFFGILGLLFVTTTCCFKLTFAATPELFISAINPGYVVDGQTNAGEFILLSRRSGDAPISLAGLVLSYTNSSGNSVPLVEFPADSWIVGESILLRLASSPEHELANLEYATTLALKAGPLELSLNGEVIDSVCWTGVDGCAADFKAKSPTTLVLNAETGVFEHQTDFVPDFNPDNYYVEPDAPEPILEPEPTVVTCQGLEFSEILSYYQKDSTEQFIEVKNVSAESVPLAGCQIRYKNKLYPLDLTEQTLAPAAYFVRELPDFKLTKDPATANTIELLDEAGTVVDFVEYLNGQKKGTSYAKIDKTNLAEWEVTYNITKGSANIYQEFRTCEAGKVINEATGNCVKQTVEEEKTCPEGKYLNPETGRCKAYAAQPAVKTCDEGYFLNPVTGRCKKLATNTGADYPVIEANADKEFSAKTAVISTLLLLSGFIIFEFRKEIKRLARRACRLVRQKHHLGSDPRSP